MEHYRELLFEDLLELKRGQYDAMCEDEFCIHCRDLRNELSGMIRLLHKQGEIDADTANRENDRIRELIQPSVITKMSIIARFEDELEIDMERISKVIR